jgi:hypothetical protein
VFCEVEDGAVLLSTEAEVYYGLNRVGARIWALLPPASVTLEDLCSTLGSQYPEVDPGALRDDVMALLEDLTRCELLVPPGQSQSDKL